MKMTTLGAIATATCLASVSTAAPRDIQFKSVDFIDNVIELHNFGSATEALDGFRTCSHDEDQIRRYSTPASFNGLSLMPGESLFIHFNNDAASFMDGMQRIDIAGRGNFAEPLDRGPYAIQIYFPPVAFGNGNTIADHVQWSIGGTDDLSADERSDEAMNGGVWTDQSLWVSTTSESVSIQLLDEMGGVLHGPENYEAVEPMTEVCLGDCDASMTVNFADLVAMLFEFGTPGSVAGCDADESGMVNFSDLVSTLFNFGPCP